MKNIDRRSSLSGIPMLDKNVVVEPKTGGGAMLRTKIRRGEGFFERFRPLVTKKGFELDDFGAFVVGQIDERRTVFDIVNAFQERFRMSRRESELGVVAFMKVLLKRNLVVIVGK
jgi:hypothetical protein